MYSNMDFSRHTPDLEAAGMALDPIIGVSTVPGSAVAVQGLPENGYLGAWSSFNSAPIGECQLSRLIYHSFATPSPAHVHL